jgi:hypothetical protein
MTPHTPENDRTKFRLLLTPFFVKNSLVTQHCWRPIGQGHQPHDLPEDTL